jgi:hypothetical protein
MKKPAVSLLQSHKRSDSPLPKLNKQRDFACEIEKSAGLKK